MRNWSICFLNDAFNQRDIFTTEAPLAQAMEISKANPEETISIECMARHRLHLKNGEVVWEQKDLAHFYLIEMDDIDDVINAVIFGEMAPGTDAYWGKLEDLPVPPAFEGIALEELVVRYNLAIRK